MTKEQYYEGIDVLNNLRSKKKKRDLKQYIWEWRLYLLSFSKK